MCYLFIKQNLHFYFQIYPHNTQGNRHIAQKEIKISYHELKNQMASSTNDTPQTHQNQCFVCNRGGHVQMCDMCPRVYHTMCQELRMNKDQLFYCQADSEYRQCEFCQKIPDLNQQNMVRCTVCFRNAHMSCYQQLLNVIKKTSKMEQEPEYLIYQEKSYVCKECLIKNGIRQIKCIQRVQTSKNFVVEQFIIALVHVNHRSTIHYGWFLEADIRTAFAAQRENPYFNKKREPKFLENRILEMQPIIEKILTMRLPNLENRKITELQALEMLLDDQRTRNLRFGDRGNIKFLVKWRKSEYYMATWEDELTVRLLDRDNRLGQFIQRRTALCSHDIDLLPNNDDSRYLKYKSQLMQESQSSDNRQFKLQNFKEIYSINIAINDHNDKDVKDIIEYLKLYYCTKVESNPTLLIVPRQKLKKWEEELIENGDQLKYLIFSGNPRSIQLIKAIEFGKNTKKLNFEVLVVEYESYKEHRSFLQQKIENAHEIILTNFSQPTFIQDLFSTKKKEQSKKLRSRLMFVVNRVVNNKSWEEEIIRKICFYFDKNTILKHTLSWSELELLNCDQARHNYTHNGVNFHHVHRETTFKKLIFLNYTLRFGFIPTNASALYDQVYSSDECRQLFKNIPENKTAFRKYVKTFYHLLIVHDQLHVPEQKIDYYLFGCDPHDVTKRIVQLYQLRRLLERQFSDFNIEPTQIVTQKGEVVGEVTNWTNRNDYVLAQLIRKQGYGNWQKMMQNTSYIQYCEKKPQGQTPYGVYLKLMLFLMAKNKLQPLDFIQRRSLAILERMSEF